MALISIVLVSAPMNIIITSVMIKASKLPKRIGPKRSRFIFVVYPMTARLPKYTVVIKNAIASVPGRYTRASVEKVIPVSIEYARNKILALVADIFIRRAPRAMTTPNCAAIRISGANRIV